MTDGTGQTRTVWRFPSVGRWGLSVLPNGWMFVTDFGIRQMVPDPAAISANVSLGQDQLQAADGLTAYIESQAKLIQENLADVKIAGPQPAEFHGAEEAKLFMVRHSPEGAPEMLHVQNYVRVGLWVGIITLTTPEAQLKAVRADYEGFVKGLRILSPESVPL